VSSAASGIKGHSRIGVTMDLYGHNLPAMLRDTADAMDQILASR
jgi:hypothetical protein